MFLYRKHRKEVEEIKLILTLSRLGYFCPTYIGVPPPPTMIGGCDTCP